MVQNVALLGFACFWTHFFHWPAEKSVHFKGEKNCTTFLFTSLSMSMTYFYVCDQPSLRLTFIKQMCLSQVHFSTIEGSHSKKVINYCMEWWCTWMWRVVYHCLNASNVCLLLENSCIPSFVRGLQSTNNRVECMEMLCTHKGAVVACMICWQHTVHCTSHM